MSTAILVAHVHPADPSSEDAFNRWYDDVHIPQVVERVPGVVSASRFFLADVQLLPEEALPARRYLSIYQLDTEDLAGTAQALGSALGDGTLDMSEAIATTGDTGPELLFYVPTERLKGNADMSDLLANKVAIVTGAGAGIGAAIARAFGAEGARVVVSDINGGAAQAVADSIDGAIAVTTDVTDEQQVKDLVDRAVEEFGGLNVVVPNAGIATTTPLIETSFEDWRKVMSVNLDGVFLTVRHSLPALVASGGGSIVNISSISSTTGSPLIGSYAAAKAAVRNLTETLSAELRFHGIRANALLPGFIDTDLVKSHQQDFENALGLESGGFDDLMVTKQTRYGRTEEVAAAAVFFASDQSSWCNGSSLVLDGGFTASLL